MRLNPTAFNRMLNGLGQSFAWRRAYACPCIKKDTGQPTHNCKNCGGKGRCWGQSIIGSAGTVSQSKLRNFGNPGMWDKDDVLLSIPSDSPLYQVGQFDRVAALHRSEPFSVNLIRGLNDVMRLPVISLERCFYLDVNQNPQELPLPEISDGGQIFWSSGGPPANTTFSLSGRRRPEYYCYLEIPTDRPMHHGADLPRRVVLRRFDLLGRD